MFAGADRNPELLQDMFTSLSNIFRHLTKHIAPQLPSILHNSAGLRYSTAPHVRGLAAESFGYLFRHTSQAVLKLAVKAVLAEAALQPSHGMACIPWPSCLSFAKGLKLDCLRTYRS